LLIEKEAARKGMCKKKVVCATSIFFVSEESRQMQRAACKPPQNKHLLEHLSHIRKEVESLSLPKLLFKC